MPLVAGGAVPEGALRSIETVMKAKGVERDRAVAFLEEKFRCMEDAAKKGASDKEIAEAGMPLTPQEFFALVFVKE